MFPDQDYIESCQMFFNDKPVSNDVTERDNAREPVIVDDAIYTGPFHRSAFLVVVWYLSKQNVLLNLVVDGGFLTIVRCCFAQFWYLSTMTDFRDDIDIRINKVK